MFHIVWWSRGGIIWIESFDMEWFCFAQISIVPSFYQTIYCLILLPNAVNFFMSPSVNSRPPHNTTLPSAESRPLVRRTEVFLSALHDLIYSVFIYILSKIHLILTDVITSFYWQFRVLGDMKVLCKNIQQMWNCTLPKKRHLLGRSKQVLLEVIRA